MIMMRRIAFQPGDWVIYRKTKHSDHPGPRARRISPSPHGDEYTYLVDKFWVVSEVRDNGEIVIKTRRGKTHTVPANDIKLRKANWWERYWFRNRFPNGTEADASQPQQSAT